MQLDVILRIYTMFWKKRYLPIINNVDFGDIERARLRKRTHLNSPLITIPGHLITIECSLFPPRVVGLDQEVLTMHNRGHKKHCWHKTTTWSDVRDDPSGNTVKIQYGWDHFLIRQWPFYEPICRRNVFSFDSLTPTFFGMPIRSTSHVE